jgi:hypothetical protein
MIRESWIHSVDRLIEKNRLLAVGFAAVVLLNVIEMITLIAVRHESRVAYVPLSGSTGLWIGAGKASDDYLRAMARYITNMLVNSTAGTIRSQLQELLVLFPPDEVGKAQTEFMHIADDRERFPSISYQVLWTGKPALKILDGRLIQVQTVKNEFVNGDATKSEQTYYCIHYRIDDTQFQLLGVQELTGTGDDLCINEAKNANVDHPAAGR